MADDIESDPAQAAALDRSREQARSGDLVTEAEFDAESDEPYALMINDERTVLVRIWSNGIVEVAIRPESGAVWGPPVVVKPEKSHV